ncbi:MAG: hypothetical protein IJX17_08350 [Clostridia bacterium]|nr:hypothetical protein [Clostridia bacterium]
MNYLFFDVESIDIKHETICSFGYYLTDEDFNVLENNDFLINPNLKDNEYDKWAIIRCLKYDFNKLLNSPTFMHYYKKIKELIINENNLVFAFAKDNEIKYLNGECRRHKLPLIFNEKNNLYDVQKIYKNYKENKNESALKKCVEELAIDTSNFNEHTSLDDALMTMLVAKKICEIENCSLEILIEKYNKI